MHSARLHLFPSLLQFPRCYKEKGQQFLLRVVFSWGLHLAEELLPSNVPQREPSFENASTGKPGLAFHFLLSFTRAVGSLHNNQLTVSRTQKSVQTFPAPGIDILMDGTVDRMHGFLWVFRIME